MRRLISFVALAVVVMLTPGCVPGVGSSSYHVTALMTDSAGLFVGNDVGILGVPVGRVTAITPDGDQVKVELEIDSDHPIPENVGAVVVARSVATDRYVELTPRYHDGPKLADGDTIALDRTRTPVDFDQVLDAINSFATGIAGSKATTDAVKRFIEAGQKAFDGQGKALNTSITSLSQASGAIASHRQDIVEALDALDRLVASFADNRQTVSRFIQQVSSATGQLADERENLRAALTSLQKAVSVLAEFAVQNKAELVGSVKSATAIMQTLLSRRTQLAEVLDVMPLALLNLQKLPHKGRLPMRVNPLVLAPLSDELTAACEKLPANLCDTLLSVGDVLGAIIKPIGDALGGIVGAGGQ